MTDYYVSTSGNDGNSGLMGDPVLTLAQAMTLAAAGDRILLTSGEQHEITADGELTIADVANVEITSTDISTPAVLHIDDAYTPTDTNQGMIDLNAGGVRIHHITFSARNFGTTAVQGLRAITAEDYGGSGNRHTGCRIYNCTFDNMFDGVHTTYVDNSLVYNCTFDLYNTGNHQNGIFFNGTACDAYDNTVTYKAAQAGRSLQVGGIRTGPASSNCDVYRNTIYGIDNGDDDGFSSGDGGGVILEGANCRAYQNTIDDCHWVDDNPGNVVFDSAGIKVTSTASGCEVYDNVITNCTNGIVAEVALGFEGYNIVWGCDTQANGVTLDATDRDVIPHLTDPANADFSPKSGSPVVGTGRYGDNRGSDQTKPATCFFLGV